MATSMHPNRHEEKSTVGFLLIIGEIIFNEQREAICLDLQRALQRIDWNKHQEINDLFNNLIHENEFHPDSHYRQMANTENGSLVGFVYAPNFHTVCNVLKDLFNLCSNVCMAFCGQQIDSTGALVLADSTFTCENLQSLFEENPSYLVQDLQIILPSMSDQWKRLGKNYLEKQLKHVQIEDLSNEIHEENFFGALFFERFYEIFNRDSVDFDIYAKLIPKDNSGTIAFDEPNLYVLYGQHGQASLFGIRGFVLLVNGGFSRNPSYWNLIRGLQNLDACILTHFDYDTLPGLQTIVHRKVLSLSQNEHSCKPDIGAVFLNRIQRAKLSEVSSTRKSKLTVNLNENIDQFYHDLKQLNIETWDLVKHTIPNKNLIEPINLYKKIAFGSLDLYVLHPTASATDDEKLIASLQKIPIGNEQRSASVIPLHHWYSACSLLVWTPSSKSKKDRLVRVLYTGVCPQTLVFEALGRVQQLEFLHDFQPQQQTVRSKETKPTPTFKTNAGAKQPPLPQKAKVSPPIASRSVPSIGQTKISKIPPRPANPKPKIPLTSNTKPDKARSPSLPKKAPSPAPKTSPRPIIKDKKIDKPRPSPPQPKQTKKPPEKLKPINNQKKKFELHKGPKPRTEHQKQLTISHQPDPKVENEEKNKIEPLTNPPEEQLLETGINEVHHIDENEEHHSDVHINEQEEHHSDNHVDEYEEHHSETHIDEHEDDGAFHQDNDQAEKSDHEISADELDENNKTSADADEEEILRPESISIPNGHDQPLVESNTSSPIEEIKSRLSPDDSMSKSFMDGDARRENPFLEKTNDTDTDDEMEIIHHDVLTSNPHSPPSVEEIHPQGLPVDNHTPSSNKSLNKTFNRSNNSSASMNSTYRLPSRSSKSSSLSDPIYHVDVAYIPNHGNENYVNSEFFRRIRARYYILDAVQINRHTLQSIMIGKEQWGKGEQRPITLVPTFDGEELRQFFVNNKTHLAELNINILPAAVRCNVQYDGESSPAQRLRFNATDEQ